MLSSCRKCLDFLFLPTTHVLQTITGQTPSNEMDENPWWPWNRFFKWLDIASVIAPESPPPIPPPTSHHRGSRMLENIIWNSSASWLHLRLLTSYRLCRRLLQHSVIRWSDSPIPWFDVGWLVSWLLLHRFSRVSWIPMDFHSLRHLN